MQEVYIFSLKSLVYGIYRDYQKSRTYALRGNNRTYMFDFFYNRDRCRKPGFLRGNIYTSCISMVLWDYFANKSNTFLSPSRSSISSHFLLWSPLPPITDPSIAQLMVMVLHQKIVLIHDARMTKYMEVASITGIEGVPLHEKAARAADAKVV